MSDYDNITVYYGEGRGKTQVALGKAVEAASRGISTNFIQFFKGTNEFNAEYFTRMEPELKYFRFQRSNKNFNDLSETEKQEESMNMKNGINFAKKVMSTRSCELLVLDEFLGLVHSGLISKEEVRSLFEAKPEGTVLVLTGRYLDDMIREAATDIYNITVE
ncbi:cob(I)yrinic acid a,c-diamide adenosyltransferase [Eubacterium oxidoreducens]|uniref:Cob(I)alamin adenosyltransferase n=1 Tax=Eubacterium oxidoreducens TaxID=1732 RepID=A0A1G6AC59_EUBOX|nr:cob(I)yrinic acid a,c-diamide adenosyltransferase [Eubacterium oxidoreducens]SDB06017.1 cob(I)alamin adenosyltransferase [Eubacterium oxidoreducens]